MKARLPSALKAVVASSFSNPKRVNFAKSSHVLLKQQGISVLAPNLASPLIEQGDNFVRLGNSECAKAPGELERVFLEKISEADFLYVANEGGYIGYSMATEMGFALALGRPVLIAQPIEKISSDVDGDMRKLLGEHSFNPLNPMQMTQEDIRKEILWENQRNSLFSDDERALLKRAGANMLCDYALGEIERNAKSSMRLGEFANYVSIKAQKRGFSEETLAQKATLMAEEKGELAKALRRFGGVKIANDSTEPLPEAEAPDLFFLLMDYCNNRGVDWSDSSEPLAALQQKASQSLGQKSVPELFWDLELKTKPLLEARDAAHTQEAALDYLTTVLGICATAGVDLESCFWRKEKLNEIRTWR